MAISLDNPFKAALAAGRRQIGLWSSLGSPVTAEIVADSGFDWLMFDTEHSPVEVADLAPLLQASARGTAHPVVRPAWNDPVLIKRVLDIGAQTLLVPFVQSADEATRAVAATRYPPAGIRGVAGMSRATRYGRVANYAATAANHLCVLVQVETGEALNGLEAIAAVEGVDGVFIGPSDLAASLDHVGNPGHPEVQEKIRYAAETLRKVGKPAGILATKKEDARRYLDWGFLFVAAGTDAGLLAAAADDLARSMKDGEGGLMRERIGRRSSK